jgi:hypothetical protein
VTARTDARAAVDEMMGYAETSVHGNLDRLLVLRDTVRAALAPELPADLAEIQPEDVERFWTKVQTGPECWTWKATLDRKGYGQFSLGGKTKAAHRIAYMLVQGAIPDGLQLDHLCRVRHCVRPSHLEPVTGRENLLRSPLTLNSISAAKTACPRGHEYTDENTYRFPDGRRSCRTCKRASDRARRAEQATS